MTEPVEPLSPRERALVARAVADTLDFLLAHAFVRLPNGRDAPPYDDAIALELDAEGQRALAAGSRL